MPAPRFQEAHSTFNSTTVYNVTNEEPDLLNLLLGRRKFKKAASILASGEVLFSVVLPRCEEVVAVDHSYGSMAVAWLKAVVLDQLGAKAMKELLFEGTKEQILATFKTAAMALPPELAPHLGLEPKIGSYSQLPYALSDIRKEWFYLKTGAVERARRKLDKVIVLHGDFTDAEQFGPFDLLYTSNAMEHQNRNRTLSPLANFAKLLAPDGLMLTAETATKGRAVPTCELVKSLKGLRTSWWYHLYKKVA